MNIYLLIESWHVIPTLHHVGTRRCCDVESTSLTFIQRHNNVVCPVSGWWRPLWYEAQGKYKFDLIHQSKAVLSNQSIYLLYLGILYGGWFRRREIKQLKNKILCKIV